MSFLFNALFRAAEAALFLRRAAGTLHKRDTVVFEGA